MARKPLISDNTPSARKTRTREHVIATQSVAYIEKFIFAAGHTAERFLSDYGYDLNMFTYNAQGHLEPGNILIQLKATSNLKLLRDGRTIFFSVEWGDIALWREELMPVILVVHDVAHETAFWVYMQQFCEASPQMRNYFGSGTVTIHLSTGNMVNELAIEKFRQFKRAIFDQTKGKVKRHG